MAGETHLIETILLTGEDHLIETIHLTGAAHFMETTPLAGILPIIGVVRLLQRLILLKQFT